MTYFAKEVGHYFCNGVAQRLALAASGRDTNQARKQNPAEVLKTAKKRADSHLSAARCVGQLLRGIWDVRTALNTVGNSDNLDSIELVGCIK